MNDIENQTNDEYLNDEPIKRSHYEGTPLLLAVQLVISIIMLIVMFTFKFVGGNYFNIAKKWYLDNINNSLIAGDDVKEYKEAFSRELPFINKNEKIIKTSCVNSQNNVKVVPVELSSVVSKPTEKGIITSKFGKRKDPLTGKENFHSGLDICAEDGTPIYAVMPGKVERAENSPSFGNVLIIDHGNNIKTLYAHCKELIVTTGDNVKRGQNIAFMGNTGYYSTGTHLHIEFIINGNKYDPEPFFENIYV